MTRKIPSLKPSGTRMLGPYAERAILFGIIVLLFVVDYQFGALHKIVAVLENTGSTFVSFLLAVGFASWVGLFTFAARRRLEMSQLIEAKSAAEASAEAAGITDPLTGLPNRVGLMMALRQRLVSSGPTRIGAVVAIDLARFKALNDMRGHQFADRVLVDVSDRLALAVQPDDFVSRTGPDEFHVLIDVVDAAEAELRAHGLIKSVAMTIDDGDTPVPIGSDAGIVTFARGREALDGETILRRADIALQAAKSCDGSVAVFKPQMEDEIRDRAELEAALEAAIGTEQIQPHFQPVIDLASNSLSGFEVLARWTHPTRGPISPTLFIPIAEESGLLGRLTTALLRRACRSAKDWPAHIKIAVNISPVEFKNPWLAQEILQILTEVGFPPQRLEVEITESALVVDHEQALTTLNSLRNQGISVALDDFGTGYASLAQLRTLPFDKIKIDQSFVRTMRENADSRMIVKAIIGLSGSLGLPTTAEGIESTSNADALRDLGCTLGQGFLYSQAVPAGAVPQLLDDLESVSDAGRAQDAPAPIAGAALEPTTGDPLVDAPDRAEMAPVRRLA